MLHLHTFHSCEKPALHPATHGQDYSGYSIPEEGQWIYIHLWLYMTLMCDVNYHVQNSVSGNMIIYMFALYLWYDETAALATGLRYRWIMLPSMAQIHVSHRIFYELIRELIRIWSVNSGVLVFYLQTSIGTCQFAKF